MKLITPWPGRIVEAERNKVIQKKNPNRRLHPSSSLVNGGHLQSESSEGEHGQSGSKGSSTGGRDGGRSLGVGGRRRRDNSSSNAVTGLLGLGRLGLARLAALAGAELLGSGKDLV